MAGESWTSSYLGQIVAQIRNPQLDLFAKGEKTVRQSL